MDAYITYDVNIRHSEIKTQMKANGYSDRWLSSNTTYYLPNTSLWKSGTELELALSDLKRVIDELNRNQPPANKIELQRCIVVSASPWTGIPGIPYSS